MGTVVFSMLRHYRCVVFAAELVVMYTRKLPKLSRRCNDRVVITENELQN